jgi:hypothetical protein
VDGLQDAEVVLGGEEVGDDGGGVLVRAACPVGVDLHRRRAIGVPESSGDRRDRDTSVEQLGRLEMTQIV